MGRSGAASAGAVSSACGWQLLMLMFWSKPARVPDGRSDERLENGADAAMPAPFSSRRRDCGCAWGDSVNVFSSPLGRFTLIEAILECAELDQNSIGRPCVFRSLIHNGRACAPPHRPTALQQGAPSSAGRAARARKTLRMLTQSTYTQPQMNLQASVGGVGGDAGGAGASSSAGAGGSSGSVGAHSGAP